MTVGKPFRESPRTGTWHAVASCLPRASPCCLHHRKPTIDIGRRCVVCNCFHWIPIVCEQLHRGPFDQRVANVAVWSDVANPLSHQRREDRGESRRWQQRHDVVLPKRGRFVCQATRRSCFPRRVSGVSTHEFCRRRRPYAPRHERARCGPGWLVQRQHVVVLDNQNIPVSSAAETGLAGMNMTSAKECGRENAAPCGGQCPHPPGKEPFATPCWAIGRIRVVGDLLPSCHRCGQVSTGGCQR